LCAQKQMNISKNSSSDTRWFKYDRDYLCVNKSQFVPVIFEPPCITEYVQRNVIWYFLIVVNFGIILCYEFTTKIFWYYSLPWVYHKNLLVIFYAMSLPKKFFLLLFSAMSISQNSLGIILCHEFTTKIFDVILCHEFITKISWYYSLPWVYHKTVLVLFCALSLPKKIFCYYSLPWVYHKNLVDLNSIVLILKPLHLRWLLLIFYSIIHNLNL
jgi:hypothetical protein